MRSSKSQRRAKSLNHGNNRPRHGQILSEVAQAHQYAESGQAIGKVTLEQ